MVSRDEDDAYARFAEVYGKAWAPKQSSAASPRVDQSIEAGTLEIGASTTARRRKSRKAGAIVRGL